MTKIDMAAFIAPKSDQLCADDLVRTPRTIMVTRVTAAPESAEQPINIFFHGDRGKPYRPCKSMRRVMVAIWGPNANEYKGRSLTLYRDPDVQFGGMKVGGIRISHMSHIDAPKTVAIQVTRGRKAQFKVEPLKVKSPSEDAAQKWTNAFLAKLPTLPNPDDVRAFEEERTARLSELEKARPDLRSTIAVAVAERLAELEGDLCPAD